MKDRNAVKIALQKRLKENPDLAAAYIFGSFVKGRLSEESDLDVGILFRAGKEPPPAQLFELQNKLSDLTGIDIDLVSLNEASPILCMQVLRNGEKIVDLNPRETHEFFIHTINFYADLKQVRKPIEKQILKGRIFG